MISCVTIIDMSMGKMVNIGTKNNVIISTIELGNFSFLSICGVQYKKLINIIAT